MEAKAYDWIITSFDPEGDFAQEAMTGSEIEIRDRLTSTHRQACGVAFGQPDRPVGLPSGSPE